MNADELIKRIVALKSNDDCNKQFSEIVTDLRALTPKDVVRVFKESMDGIKGNIRLLGQITIGGRGRVGYEIEQR